MLWTLSDTTEECRKWPTYFCYHKYCHSQFK